MRERQNIFIYRPLSTESEAKIRDVQDEYAMNPSFSPVEDLHVTLLATLSRCKLSPNHKSMVVQKAPASTVKPYETTVERAETHRRKDVTRLAIKLMLDESIDDLLREERTMFEDRVRKVNATAMMSRVYKPHITIGYIDYQYGVSSLLNATQPIVGSDLTLLPVESNIGTIETARTRPWYEQVRIAGATDLAIRTVQPQSIPAGFLRSLGAPRP